MMLCINMTHVEMIAKKIFDFNFHVSILNLPEGLFVATWFPKLQIKYASNWYDYIFILKWHFVDNRMPIKPSRESTEFIKCSTSKEKI